MMVTKVKIGTTFRSGLADGNPLWKIIKKVGSRPATYLCDVVNEPVEFNGKMFDSDFAGHSDTFLKSAIEQKLRFSDAINHLVAEKESFWDSQKVGTTYHYQSSRGQWIRGVVDTREDDKGRTEKFLKWTNLIGDWRHELPQVRADGSVYKGYYIENIEKGDGNCPSESQLYECNSAKFSDNPTQMEPIDLTIPEPSEDEKKEQELWQKVNKVRDLLQSTNESIKSDGKSPEHLLDEIRGVVGQGYRRLFNF